MIKLSGKLIKTNMSENAKDKMTGNIAVVHQNINFGFRVFNQKNDAVLSPSNDV